MMSLLVKVVAFFMRQGKPPALSYNAICVAMCDKLRFVVSLWKADIKAYIFRVYLSIRII